MTFSSDRRRNLGIKNQNKEFKSLNSNTPNYYISSSNSKTNRSKKNDLQQKKSANNIYNTDICNPMYGKPIKRSFTEPSNKDWSSFKKDKKYIEPSDSDSNELINYPPNKNESYKMLSTPKNILNNTNYGTSSGLNLNLNSLIQQKSQEISFPSQEEDTISSDNNNTNRFILKGSSPFDDGSEQFTINNAKKNNLNNTNYGTNSNLPNQQKRQDISFSSQKKDKINSDNNNTNHFILKGSSSIDDVSVQFINDNVEKNNSSNTNYDTNLILNLNSNLSNQQKRQDISFSSQKKDKINSDDNNANRFTFKGSSSIDDGSVKYIIDKMEKNFKKLAKLLDEEEDFI